MHRARECIGRGVGVTRQYRGITVQTQNTTACLRAIAGPTPLAGPELDRECRAVWDNIAGETGSRIAHAKRIARLYNLCRDVQQIGPYGARLILRLVRLVVARSYGMQPEAA
jgi:hypothetical protein